MKEVEFNAYHGTDQKCLHNITIDGFKCKENDEHWLGNGIYFFIEYDLAKWWALIKHSKFGNNVDTPVVIEVELSCDSDDIVDLRVLENYNWIYKQTMNSIAIYYAVVHINLPVIN